MITVYTVDPQQGFADVAPLTLAADGSTVYATTARLYVTSGGVDAPKTQIHRFDIAGTGRPTYLGSGSVPGRVLDAYSLGLPRFPARRHHARRDPTKDVDVGLRPGRRHPRGDRPG